MARFSVLGKGLTQAEVDALKALMAGAGCMVHEIAVVNTVGEPDANLEDEIICVLATPAICADAELEANLKKAAKGARRVIWVWPQDGQPTELPAAAAKYCYSVIPWDAEKLRAVSADDDVMCFETISGAPLPKVTTERNLCVEIKAETEVKAEVLAKSE